MKYHLEKIEQTMKNILTLFFLLACITTHAQNLPENTNKLVNDFTNTLSVQEQEALSKKLIAYNDSTSTQVAILVVDNYKGFEAMDYTIRVAEAWGIGQKDRDNGILISVAMDERKMAIATGYGVEDRITDAATAIIREQYMKPAFRKGDYYAGLDQATTVIFDLAAGKYKADKLKQNDSGNSFGIFGILLIIVIITIISRINRVRKHHMGGGSLDFLTIMMLLGSGNRHGGSWGDFNSGGGGFGGGGGGFGGFGGGSFGGGGSSGSW